MPCCSRSGDGTTVKSSSCSFFPSPSFESTRPVDEHQLSSTEPEDTLSLDTSFRISDLLASTLRREFLLLLSPLRFDSSFDFPRRVLTFSFSYSSRSTLYKAENEGPKPSVKFRVVTPSMADGLEQAPFKGMKKGETTKANPGIFASFMGEFELHSSQVRSELALGGRDLLQKRG